MLLRLNKAQYDYLIQYNKLSKYIDYIENRKILNNIWIHSISASFLWSGTVEGDNFWRSVHELKYNDYVLTDKNDKLYDNISK